MSNDRANFPNVIGFPDPERDKSLIRYGAEQVIYARAFEVVVKDEDLTDERVNLLYQEWKAGKRGIGV